MAKYSNQEKISKMAIMLRGLQLPAIQLLLAPRGLDAAEYEEGWTHFETAMGRSLKTIQGASSKNQFNVLLGDLDRWENSQFDVADACLKHRFPAVHAELFENLTKMSGPEVLVSVGTFVTRYDALAARTDETSKSAVALLAKRGITTDSVAGVRALLVSARSMPDAGPAATDAEQLALMDEAVARMWAWYQEWAQTARVAIPSKRLRIHLGISSPNPNKPEEPEVPSVE
ncbi:hypothetical protein KJ975_03125 [Myxococcota bacterium]|nr:hypothetical protein [Myxococcota bacterium]